MTSRRSTTGLCLAAVLAAMAVGCSDSNDDANNTLPSPTTAGEPTSIEPSPVLPADFPEGSFGRTGIPSDRLGLNRAGTATLADANGSVNQRLTSPGASRVTFSPDSFLCDESGTYRYSYQGTTLTFTLVSDDCQGRRDFLLKAPFQKQS